MEYTHLIVLVIIHRRTLFGKIFIMDIAYSDSFLKALDSLDPGLKDIVKVKMFDLQTNPRTPGFNLEKLAGGGLYSGRINDNLRLIMGIEGEQTIVLYVDNHDDAYTWAANHRLEVNQTTGSLQLVDIETVREQVTLTEQVYVQAKLFEQYDDEYLLALGVPESYLLPVKNATKEHLEWLLDRLPSEVMERLLQLEDGILVPIPRGHDGSPLDHPDAKRHFVTVKATDELNRALEFPWAQWAVFLHPDQRDLVETSFTGPAKISGAAGTGKTVVAVHRAFRLARENPSANVLLTTFSRTLAARITQMIEMLSGGQDGIPENLTVTNIHSLALQIWSKHNPGEAFRPAEDEKIKEDLTKAIGLRILGPISLGVVLSEWENVIDYWGITDWGTYRTFPRTGRGTILGQNQREELWSVFGPVLEELASSAGMMTWSQLAFASSSLAQSHESGLYQHIVVDEVQDFGPAEISLLRALVPPGPDDLFLCGDSGQRIFRRPFSWSSIGIRIQGRSRQLRTNYRNTEQIQRLAETVLTAPSIGGDGEEEPRYSVSLLTGDEPLIKVCADESEEIICLAEWLQDMIRLGYQENEIAVFSRRTRTLSSTGNAALRMVDQLKRRDLQDSRAPSSDGISFGTMHGAKGLEFKAVAVIGCGAENIPDPEMLERACDEAERAEIIEQERSLLHVALTRPRERLLVTCSNELSNLMPA
jgi:superfamily I DNA/RNA helicase/mRNA-degrading endonuclease RelE of RelBE toxin-antitoxin system